jgi:hypothetical protein
MQSAQCAPVAVTTGLFSSRKKLTTTGILPVASTICLFSSKKSSLYYFATTGSKCYQCAHTVQIVFVDFLGASFRRTDNFPHGESLKVFKSKLSPQGKFASTFSAGESCVSVNK